MTSETVALDLRQGSLLIEHNLDGEVVPQRPRDGYINATLLCQRAGKLFGDYSRNRQTKDYLGELSADMGIPISALVQTIRGGNDKLSQGTWVHPKVAINLGQWLSPVFAVQVSNWVFAWMTGEMKAYMPLHVKRYMRNRSKVPHTHFSMLNEIYLNFLAPLEDYGIRLPDKVTPDISTGRMFSGFLRSKGIAPESFPTYEHEFMDGTRPTVQARLYPIEYLPDFRRYFNEEWLPDHAQRYLQERVPRAVPYIDKITMLPSS